MISAHVARVCRAGEAAARCRYLAIWHGFACLKGTSHQAAVDARVRTHWQTARGDNCAGQSADVLNVGARPTP